MGTLALSARLRPGESLGDRALKVNHAGEHGAVCIYAGQRWVARFTAPSMLHELERFQADERRHRDVFAAELARRGVRRCRSYLPCGVGGFVLGCATGLLGRRAIDATTVGVEQVVLRHLRAQMNALRRSDESAVHTIKLIVADEREHHQQSSMRLGDQSAAIRALTLAVAWVTESVIWLGMHL
jgi:3-demethoxyubiquinol 3-hydroxylase